MNRIILCKNETEVQHSIIWGIVVIVIAFIVLQIIKILD